MKKHPLARVFRVDKYTIAALSRVLFEYYDLKEAKKNVPVLRIITITNEELKNNAQFYVRKRMLHHFTKVPSTTAGPDFVDKCIKSCINNVPMRKAQTLI